MHKALNLTNHLWIQYLLIVVCFGATSCLQNHSSQLNPAIKNKTIKLPEAVVARNPVVINCDGSKKPPRYRLPLKGSTSYSVKTKEGIHQRIIYPAEIRPASFFSDMPKFGTDEGLMVPAVVSSLVDRNGRLWMGTHGGGVTCYDGKSSVTFTANQGLENNSVARIIEDSVGNIWFASGGIAKYDGRSISSFTTRQGLIHNEVHDLAVDKKGIFWLATRFGVSRFDGKSFTNFTTSDGLGNNDVKCCKIDKKGNIWFGTAGGASCYNGKAFINFTTAEGLIDNDIKYIAEDKHGNIWFGAGGGGLSMYDGKSFTNFSYPDLPRSSIHCITEDKVGNLWFGTYSSGVFRYDGKTFVQFSTKQGLSDDIVSSISEDKSGNLWIGTYGGMSCYQGKAFISFSKREGLPGNTVRNVIEDKKGIYWFATNAEGVCRYDGNTFTIFNKSQGLNHGRIHRIFEDNSGQLWFGTAEGVSQYDGETITNFTTKQGIAHMAVRCILQDNKGNMWFGTEVGLSKYDGKSFSNFTRAQGLSGDNVRDMVEDEAGNLWLGIHGAGVSRFDGKTIINLDTAQGLVNLYVFCMTKDSKGNIWIGTGNGGVSILRKEIAKKLENIKNIKGTDRIFENFTTKEGLADDAVYDIVEDKTGNIVIGTNLGLTIIKGGLLPQKPISKDQLEYYNRKTGYPVKDVNTQSMYVDSKGFIWAGTGEELVRLDYAAIHKNVDPPIVRIQSLKINNEKLGWYNLFSHIIKEKTGGMNANELSSAINIEEKMVYDETLAGKERDSVYRKFSGIKFDSITPFNALPVNLTLPYKYNNVTFDFTAIELVRPGHVRYQYMLEGYDQNWNPLNTQSVASFGNIDEGKYIFKVKALSAEGIWSAPLEFGFEVLPPWHRSWWAYAGYILILLFILYSIYKDQIRRLEKKQARQLQTVINTQEEERKRISRDLHDDVGTKLSALKLFLSSLKSNADKKQYQQLGRLASNSEQLINETIKDVREMLLNLSPGILEEFGFTTAIEGLVGKINQTNTIHFDLLVFGMKDNLKKEYELALYRMTQELINNVLKHSEAGKVSLQIGYRDEKIIIMIEDDGKGFDLNVHKDGYGLKNLEARAKLLKGTMNIDTFPGKGTSVFIEVPYKFI